MSRELLITTGFVQVLAPAALVGLAAGLIYGAATGLPGRPDEPQGAHSGTKWPRLWTRNWPKVPTELTPLAIPLGFAVPAFALVDQDLSTMSTMLVMAGLVAYAWVVAVAVWRVGRRSAEDRLAGRLGHQRPRWKPTSTWLRLLAIALGLALPSLLVLTLVWPLLEAVGTAAAVAASTWILLVAARILGPQVGEKRLANKPDGTEPAPILTHGLPTWIALLPLAALLASPGAFLLFGEGRQSWVELSVVAAGIIVNWAALAVCWYALRTVVPARARDGKTRHRAGRGLVAGLLWTAIALPGAITLAGFLPLEPARVCLRGPQPGPPVEGVLVAETENRVLIVTDKSAEGRRAVVSLPADQVRRLEFGRAADTLQQVCDATA